MLDGDELMSGETGWAQLQVWEPLAWCEGDRYIVRLPSPSVTLGGGVMVDPHPRRRHKRRQREVWTGWRRWPAARRKRCCCRCWTEVRSSRRRQSGQRMSRLRPRRRWRSWSMGVGGGLRQASRAAVGETTPVLSPDLATLLEILATLEATTGSSAAPGHVARRVPLAARCPRARPTRCWSAALRMAQWWPQATYVAAGHEVTFAC